MARNSFNRCEAICACAFLGKSVAISSCIVFVSRRVPRVTQNQNPAYIELAIATKTINRRYQGRCGSLPSFISLFLIVGRAFREGRYFFIATWFAVAAGA